LCSARARGCAPGLRMSPRILQPAKPEPSGRVTAASRAGCGPGGGGEKNSARRSNDFYPAMVRVRVCPILKGIVKRRRNRALRRAPGP
jgi:hypothetical protein